MTKNLTLKKIEALTTVPTLSYNYEATPIEKKSLMDGEEIANFIRPFFDQGTFDSQEEFLLCMLNDANYPIGVFKLFKGTQSAVQIDHHLILSLLLSSRCDYFFIAHNHPSGDSLVSKPDVDMTISLKHKVDYFDIVLYDHVIVTRDSYYSFNESFGQW